MEKIKIGIVGYGNLGKGVHHALKQNCDMEPCGIFTRRNPLEVDVVDKSIPVFSIDEVEKVKDKIDVMILCGGSATDLPVMTPAIAEMFNVVDSFDNHSKIPEHFKNVNACAIKGNHTAVISAGWDPGLFSLQRLLGETFLPVGKTNTFWGKGVSQGHSDAIRRIAGVLDAKQYTIPVEGTVSKVRSGSLEEYSAREKHLRQCFVVVEDGADKERIKNEIVTMPAYFEPYDTEVNFISKEEFQKNHREMPHGGFVIRGGATGENNQHGEIMEFSLKLDSNPEFTSSVLVAFARSAYKMNKLGEVGAKTVFDIKPQWLSMKTSEEMLKELL